MTGRVPMENEVAPTRGITAVDQYGGQGPRAGTRLAENGGRTDGQKIRRVSHSASSPRSSRPRSGEFHPIARADRPPRGSGDVDQSATRPRRASKSRPRCRSEDRGAGEVLEGMDHLLGCAATVGRVARSNGSPNRLTAWPAPVPMARRRGASMRIETVAPRRRGPACGGVTCSRGPVVRGRRPRGRATRSTGPARRRAAFARRLAEAEGAGRGRLAPVITGRPRDSAAPALEHRGTRGP